jgi:hypothetical protein
MIEYDTSLVSTSTITYICLINHCASCILYMKYNLHGLPKCRVQDYLAIANTSFMCKSK